MSDRTDVVAPHRYIACDRATVDIRDRSAWLAMPATAIGDSRVAIGTSDRKGEARESHSDTAMVRLA
jgi:hypothetical protein